MELWAGSSDSYAGKSRMVAESKGQSQRNAAYMRPAQTTKETPYLSLKESLAVLCLKTSIPSNPPGHPPIAPIAARWNSLTRLLLVWPARNLSYPKRRKASTLERHNHSRKIFNPASRLCLSCHHAGNQRRREHHHLPTVQSRQTTSSRPKSRPWRLWRPGTSRPSWQRS